MNELKLFALCSLLLTVCACSQPAKQATGASIGVTQLPTVFQNPVELGAVHWYRNLDKAKQVAGKSKRDLLILFQEVPG